MIYSKNCQNRRVNSFPQSYHDTVLYVELSSQPYWITSKGEPWDRKGKHKVRALHSGPVYRGTVGANPVFVCVSVSATASAQSAIRAGRPPFPVRQLS
jgi:hypothetical protein